MQLREETFYFVLVFETIGVFNGSDRSMHENSYLDFIPHIFIEITLKKAGTTLKLIRGLD